MPGPAAPPAGARICFDTRKGRAAHPLSGGEAKSIRRHAFYVEAPGTARTARAAMLPPGPASQRPARVPACPRTAFRLCMQYVPAARTCASAAGSLYTRFSARLRPPPRLWNRLSPNRRPWEARCAQAVCALFFGSVLAMVRRCAQAVCALFFGSVLAMVRRCAQAVCALFFGSVLAMVRRCAQAVCALFFGSVLAMGSTVCASLRPLTIAWAAACGPASHRIRRRPSGGPVPAAGLSEASTEAAPGSPQRPFSPVPTGRWQRGAGKSPRAGCERFKSGAVFPAPL